jgi:hypothetical protein
LGIFDGGDVVGVHFRQQMRRKASVPDGLIVQKPLTVYIETKSFDWFYDAQLERHLEALADDGTGAKALIALGNFEVLADDRFEKVEHLCGEKFQGRIFFAAATFEDFLAALPKDKSSKNLSDTIDDFEGYLDEMDLVPRWKHRLDVVNCTGRPSDIMQENVYICPARGGAYNHSRARYFGMYQWKAVRQVAQIDAVVDIDGDGGGTLRWKHVETPDVDLVARAREKVARLRPYPFTRFYAADGRSEGGGLS